MADNETSPETWEVIRLANIRGVQDKELSERYGVTREAIRQRRCRDKAWQAAVTPVSSLKNEEKIEELSQIVTGGQNGAEIAQKAALTIQEAIQGGKLQNELLLLKLAGNGLRSAEGNLPQVKAWADIKAIADIVSKIGPQAQNAVQVNVLTDGPASVEHCEFPVFEADE